MRIGIISDSHGNTMAIDMAVKMAGKVDCWLHAGDLIGDVEYLSMVTEKEIFNVAGNCDWPQMTVPDALLISKAGHRIFLAHGHNYGVKRSSDEIKSTAIAKGADIVVYGHTHVAVIQQEENCLTINPGSISFPRDGEGQSFMVLNINQKAVQVEHFHL